MGIFELILSALSHSKMVFYTFAVILAFSSIAQSVPLPQYYYAPQRMTYNTPQRYYNAPQRMTYNTPQNYADYAVNPQIQFTKEDVMEMVERILDPAIWEKVTNVDWSPVTNGINNADWAKTFSGLGIAQATSY